jgi:hypothetical protein
MPWKKRNVLTITILSVILDDNGGTFIVLRLRDFRSHIVRQFPAEPYYRTLTMVKKDTPNG